MTLAQLTDKPPLRLSFRLVQLYQTECTDSYAYYTVVVHKSQPQLKDIVILSPRMMGV